MGTRGISDSDPDNNVASPMRKEANDTSAVLRQVGGSTRACDISLTCFGNHDSGVMAAWRSCHRSGRRDSQLPDHGPSNRHIGILPASATSAK